MIFDWQRGSLVIGGIGYPTDFVPESGTTYNETVSFAVSGATISPTPTLSTAQTTSFAASGAMGVTPAASTALTVAFATAAAFDHVATFTMNAVVALSAGAAMTVATTMSAALSVTLSAINALITVTDGDGSPSGPAAPFLQWIIPRWPWRLWWTRRE